MHDGPKIVLSVSFLLRSIEVVFVVSVDIGMTRTIPKSRWARKCTSGSVDAGG